MARSGSRRRVLAVAAMVAFGVVGGVGLRHRVQAQPDAGAARDPALLDALDAFERASLVTSERLGGSYATVAIP